MNGSPKARPGRGLRTLPGVPRLVVFPRLAVFPLLAALALLAAPPVAAAQQESAAMVAGVDPDTVEAGRFDNGKMWTFEFPPIDYLAEEYGFRPDSSWFRRARLGALRLPGCSASFVSPHGLVMTNHHCARESISKMSREGESLLDDGFYATGLEEERPIEDYHADRLVAIEDVTDDVYATLEGLEGDARAERRDEILDELEGEILDEYGGEDGGHVVEMISLYDGAFYSAYVFRRYTDVRLVMAPELQIGFYGGDPDNFTYPRYNLDVSFYRIYEDGEPMEVDVYFPFDDDGLEAGDLVFVLGNPGSTSRLQTVAELEFRRDVSDAAVLDFIRSRAAVLEEFIEDHPEVAEERDLRNTLFGLLNSEKAYTGQIAGLHDPMILARRRATQDAFLEAIAADPELRDEYGGLIQEMADIQARKREFTPAFGAFLALTSDAYASSTLRRALFAFQILSARQQGAPDQAIAGLLEQFRSVGDTPESLDEGLIAARFRDFVRTYGEDSDLVEAVLEGRTPEGAAASLRARSSLSDSATAVQALETGSLDMRDPAVQVVQDYLPLVGSFQQTLSQLGQREEEIAARLGRARFEIYGTDVPPDATFSLRIADGVVQGYDYNGTVAPPLTTFYGLYDHYHSYLYTYEEASESPWDLPERWLEPPTTFDLSTPLNFVSTADIIGGNSGSPVLDTDLEVVGLVFDGNIESLPGDYIYLPEKNRAVAVDARGIVEALDEIYDADRIVLEVTTGTLAPTEAEADRVRAGGR